MTLGNRIAKSAAVACAALAIVAAALAEVDLSLEPASTTVSIGSTAAVEVRIASNTGQSQPVAALQMIFTWSDDHLAYIGLEDAGKTELLYSNLPNDPYNINQAAGLPGEADANGQVTAIYQALAPLGDPIIVGPEAEGTLITTLYFETLKPTKSTTIEILQQAGAPIGYTVVFDGAQPNHDILGKTVGAAITISGYCPTDLDLSGSTDIFDLLALLGAWGRCPADDLCTADLDGNGTVDVFDLLVLLEAWGACE